MSDYFEDPEDEAEPPKAFEKELIVIIKHKGSYRRGTFDGPDIGKAGVEVLKRDPKNNVYVFSSRDYPEDRD